MANEYRVPADFMYGTLTSAVSLSDTSLSSSEFSGVRTISGTSTFTPIVLLDPSSRRYEVVWLTTHGTGATTATVLRGKETSVAQDWPAGTQWLASPTTRDVVSNGFAGTGMVADAHVGMRQAITDKGEVWEKTLFQGWLGTVHANREDMGRAVDGTASPANGNTMMVKAFTAQATTNASGIATFAIPNGGFPTRTLTASITRATTTWFNPIIDSGTTTKTVLGVLCQSAAFTPLASTAVILGCIVIGY